MKYSIKKNWSGALEMMVTKPFVIMPFIVVAFLEALAFELIYFSPRKPVLLIAGPLIRKFFGEPYLHYPLNLTILPKLFYNAQIAIYILFWGFLAAITVNIVKNVRSNLPVKPNALIKNALGRYFSFISYGITIIALLFLAQKADMFVFSKYMRLISKHAPEIMIRLAPLKLGLFLFFSNVLIEVFFLLMIPLIVIQKKPFFKAIGKSVTMGVGNFFTLLALILAPFLLYLPLAMARSLLPQLINKTAPEISIIITAAGIIVSIFVDCFVTICAAQFLLDKESS